MQDRNKRFVSLLQRLIALIGVIVPRRFRLRWQREWEAELEYREDLLARWDRLDWRSKIELFWRSLGAFWDALWLQQLRWEDEMIQDLRFGVRMLIKHKGFTAVAVLTLALGIGANTALFSLLDAVFLKLLPVQEPERLFVLKTTGFRSVNYDFSYPLFSRLRDENRVFAGTLATSGPGQAKLRVEGSASDHVEYVVHESVSGGYFSTLGVRALFGSTFVAGDDKGGQRVAVISHDFWRRRFASDPSIVGKTITLDEFTCTIIGVTAPGFFGVSVGTSVDAWTLLAQVWQPSALSDPDLSYLLVLARLQPGVTEEQAGADGTRILQPALVEWSGRFSDQITKAEFLSQRIGLDPAGTGISHLRAKFSSPLQILMVIVGLLLLIACANIANLLLARAEARQKEIAVRLALGASRLRLVRQLLTESLLLAALGAGLGLLLAVWGRNLLLTFIPQGNLPLRLGPALDMRVLAVTGAIALTTSLLFGLAPALRATRVNLMPALKDARRSPGGGGHRPGLGSALVVVQVALSLVLLISAGLVVRSLQRLQNLDAGFNWHNVLTFGLDLPRDYRDEQSLGLSRQLLGRIKNLPGVRTASISFPGPFLSGRWKINFSVEGYLWHPGENRGMDCMQVLPEFFEALGITLQQGRTFTPQDDANAPKVAIINENTARYFFPQESPLGKRLTNESGNPRSTSSFEIIGVVKDARHRGFREAVPRIVYLPTLQSNNPRVSAFIVRTSGDPELIIASIRREGQALDRNVVLRDVKTIEERVDESLFRERIVAKLATFFGLLALLLTCLGLYGVLAYAVSRRTAEIGIRVALGAQPRVVLKLIIGQGVWLTSSGVGIGLLAAFGMTRWLRGFLFEISPTDPLTFAAIAFVLTATALLASYLPARRATKVDPLVALRHE